MRLSDIRGEEAIDVLADIFEPLALICADEEIRRLQAQEKPSPMMAYIKPILKNRKKEIIQILARINNQTEEEYTANLSLVTLPAQILEFMTDPEIQSLFTSQSQSPAEPLASSGSVTESTEAEGK